MKVKTFQRYICEEEERNIFNAFVEEVFDGKWSVAFKEFGNFTDKFHCSDVSDIYRILFFPITEIQKLTKDSDLKRKVSATLTSENQGHPRFYTKDDYHNIKDHLSFLSSLGQNIHGYTDDSAESLFMGLIISKSVDMNDNVDFTHYKNGNSQIQDRIDRTKPVLSVNPNGFDFKIVASLEFDTNGWEILEYTGVDDLQNSPDTGEEDTEETDEINPEEEGVTKQ